MSRVQGKGRIKRPVLNALKPGRRRRRRNVSGAATAATIRFIGG